MATESESKHQLSLQSAQQQDDVHDEEPPADDETRGIDDIDIVESQKKQDAEESDPESDWQEFPLFAPKSKLIPKPSALKGEQAPSALEMISDLLYREQTPTERAELYMDKGNRYLKLSNKQNAKAAVGWYTKAIECIDVDSSILSKCYSNRAAAELKLGNYRNVIHDCDKATELDAGNFKAMYRKGKALLDLLKLDDAKLVVEQCLKFLSSQNTSNKYKQEILVTQQLLDKILATMKRMESTQIRADKAKSLEVQEQEKMASMLKSRNISFGHYLFSQQRDMKPNSPEILNETNIVWPVLFIYPSELSDGELHTDFVEHFHEDDTLLTHLKSIFDDQDQDIANVESAIEVLYRQKWTRLSPKYPPTPDQIQQFGPVENDAYYVGSLKTRDEVGGWVSVPPTRKLKEILRRPDYIVPGFPSFFLVPKGFRPSQFL